MRSQQSLAPLLGVGICAVLASSLCLFLERSSIKASIPIYFLILVTIVALRFGSLAGMLGTVVAAAVFAMFLFEPLGSLAVRNVNERNSLIWLLLFGVALSELCGHAPPDQHSMTRPSLRPDDFEDSASAHGLK